MRWNYRKQKKQNEEEKKKADQQGIKIVIEKAVANLVEVNCSVFGNYAHQETSVIEEVTSDDDFLTFKDKEGTVEKK